VVLVSIVPEEQVYVGTVRDPELVLEEQVQVTGGEQEAPEAPLFIQAPVDVQGEQEYGDKRSASVHRW
jgi:hypothetical protein